MNWVGQQLWVYDTQKKIGIQPATSAAIVMYSTSSFKGAVNVQACNLTQQARPRRMLQRGWKRTEQTTPVGYVGLYMPLLCQSKLRTTSSSVSGFTMLHTCVLYVPGRWRNRLTQAKQRSDVCRSQINLFMEQLDFFETEHIVENEKCCRLDGSCSSYGLSASSFLNFGIQLPAT